MVFDPRRERVAELRRRANFYAGRARAVVSTDPELHTLYLEMEAAFRGIADIREREASRSRRPAPIPGQI